MALIMFPGQAVGQVCLLGDCCLLCDVVLCGVVSIFMVYLQ